MWLPSSRLSPRPAVMWPTLTRLVSAGAGVTRVNKKRAETPRREPLCVVPSTRQSDAGQTVMGVKIRESGVLKVQELFVRGGQESLSKCLWLTFTVRPNCLCHISV